MLIWAFFDLYVKFLKAKANDIITNIIKKLISLNLKKYIPLYSENQYLVITIDLQKLVKSLATQIKNLDKMNTKTNAQLMIRMFKLKSHLGD